MTQIVIPGEWRTTVSATPTGNVIITQKSGRKKEQVIVIPADYNFAICTAIHQAHKVAK